ncbi:hypothetical protein [Kordia sp.]|uniref:hypothetical protein n=1 Tax=Kordia sp. TaxID=1965332 RepID=UPI003D28D0C1
MKKYTLIVFFIFCFSSCVVFYTETAIPQKKSPIIRILPEFFNGTYELGYLKSAFDIDFDKIEFGKTMINFNKPNFSNICQVEIYSEFTKSNLQNNKYYSIVGDYLFFKNDSLIRKLNDLKSKKDISPTLFTETKELEKLNTRFNNGELSWSRKVTKLNDAFVTDKKLLCEINIDENKLKFFGVQKYNNREHRIVLKKSPISSSDIYILNILENDGFWNPIFIIKQGNQLKIMYLDHRTYSNDKIYYNNFFNVIDSGNTKDNEYILYDVISFKEDGFKEILNERIFLEVASLMKNKNTYDKEKQKPTSDESSTKYKDEPNLINKNSENSSNGSKINTFLFFLLAIIVIVFIFREIKRKR